MSDIGKRLKELRNTLGITQRELANRIGVKTHTVTIYECGRSTPIDSVISLICREFSVSKEWLRNGTGEMFLPTETSTLDRLAKEYHLSSYERKTIENYVTLPSNQRAVLEKFIASLDDQP